MALLFLDPKLVPAGTPLPNSAQEIVNLVAQHTGIGGIGNVNFINIGNNTPAVEDRDKPWFNLDVNGFSLGWWYFVDGIWRPERPIGQITWFAHMLTTAPVGYRLLNGVGNYLDEEGNSHPVPDWKDRVAVGSGGIHAPGDTGGADTLSASLDLPSTTGAKTLSISELPEHDLSIPVPLTEGAGADIPLNKFAAGVNDGFQFGISTARTGKVGGDQPFTMPLDGKATGDLDVRQKFIAAPALVWVAA